MAGICAHLLNIHQRIECTRHALWSVQTLHRRSSISCRLQSTVQSHNHRIRFFPSWAAGQVRRLDKFRRLSHVFLPGTTCTKTGHRLASVQHHIGSTSLLGQHIQVHTECRLPETHLAPCRFRIVRTTHLCLQSRCCKLCKSHPMTLCLFDILCSLFSMQSALFQLHTLHMLRRGLPFQVGKARTGCRRSLVPRHHHTVHRRH